MPQRFHKYDRPPYSYVMRPQDRRYRKAFYFVERLAQIDQQFNQHLHEVQIKVDQGKIPLPQAEQIIRQEIMQAIKRQQRSI